LRQQVNQLPAARDQGVQFPLMFREFFTEDEVLNMLRIADQQAGVDRIGLGEPAHAAGEIADTGRQDDGDRIVAFDEKVDEFDVVRTGRFEHDLLLVWRRQLGRERIKSARFVVEPLHRGGLR